MAKVADLGSKRLVQAAPDGWVRWVTQQPDLMTQELVQTEFQWVSRDTDVLVKVTSPRLGDFLVLTEFQLRPDRRMARRIRAYAALAEERYDCPVYPVLINILPTTQVQAVASRYESEFLGLVVRQDYRTINLWDIDVNVVFEQPLPSLLPFVPILQGGANEATIRRALGQLRDDEQLSELESLLAFFATFVLDSAVVQEIMRWDMAILRQSPWYQEILQEGEARGRAEGEARGSKQAAMTILLKQLTRQLGIDAAIWRQRLESLSVAQLETLAEALFDFSTEADLEGWLMQDDGLSEL